MHPSRLGFWAASAVLAGVIAASPACGQQGDTSAATSSTDASTTSATGGAAPVTSSTTGTGGAGGTSSGAGGEGLPTSGISIIVEPDGMHGDQIPAAISAAQTSVHMTMYILSDHGTIDALIERHQAGVDVKVVLNQNFPGDSTDSQSNQHAFDDLQSAGVPVVWAPGVFEYTHEKSFVVDGTTAWIMTMNAANSSPDDNREYLAIDTIPEHVQEDEAVFEGDFAGAPLASVDGPLVVAPINAHADLDAFVATAKSTIDIEAEELSDDTFIDALVAASHTGVAIRVVLPDPDPNSFNDGHALTSAQQEALTRMKAAAFGLVWIANPYVHAKTIVVDGTSAYVGSANYTYTSLEMNRELGVLFAVDSEIAKITATINQDFAAGTPF